MVARGPSLKEDPDAALVLGVDLRLGMLGAGAGKGGRVCMASAILWPPT